MIIPVYNGAEYLDECLRSVRGQDYRRLDVVVIDDGSTDDSFAIAQRHARSDRRVTVLKQANAGVGEARRAAVAVATGQYLTFVDADDAVLGEGLRAAMEVLVETGSDVAALPYQRQEAMDVRPPAPWIRALHARPARGVTLADRPDVLVNAIACAKIFRRAFWDANELGFPTVLLGGDQIVTAQAYRDADGIDISDVMAYTWRRMGSSISQGQVTPDAVHARMDAIERVLEVLESLPEIRSERALQYLRYNVPNSVLKLERADDAYLGALIERVPRVVDAAPSDRYAAEVPAEFRVLYALLRAADHDSIWRFVRAEGMQAQMHPSGQEPAGLTSYLPGWRVNGLPAETYVLTAEQTGLRVKVHSAQVVGPDLVLDLAAWFPNIAAADPVLTIKSDGGVVDVEHGGTPAVFESRLGSRRFYPGSGWTLQLRGAAHRRPHTITVTLEDAGREGTVSTRVPARP